MATTAGYSGTPLLKKLGIKEGMKVTLINPPENYFELLEKDLTPQLTGKKEIPDLVHLFVVTYQSYEKAIQSLQPIYKANPALVIWVSWYKKSAGMATDMTEDRIRDYALKNGLVDIKVCAVSELWSGLKLVVPKARR